MVDSCCKLVGNFPISADGIISVSSKGKTEAQIYQVGGGNAQYTVSPSTGTVSISAYASFDIHIGCPGRAGVTVNWIRKSNCDEYIYLFGGLGPSYISGDTENFVNFESVGGVPNPLATINNTVNVSASSGPAALYEQHDQADGYGLVYDGFPWNISTYTEDGSTVDLTAAGIGDYGKCMLQSLSLQCTPGQLPIVNMDFLYNIAN